MVPARVVHTPPGSQDLLSDDVRRRRRIQHAWFTLAEDAGYEEVIPPTFEYEEIFTRGGGSELAAQLIRFLDGDGRLVALRADFTSSVARLAATKLAAASLPLRLSYAGKVYRQQAEGRGRARETFQLGAELIGMETVEADAEILRLTIELLQRLGIADFQINLGESRFLRPLLSGLRAEDAERLRTAIDRRDRSAIRTLVRELNLSSPVSRTLLLLPELIGRGDALRQARAAAPTPEAEAAIRRLLELDTLLSAEHRPHIVYDLGEVRGFGYYTGMQFEVYVAGVGRAVGFGGRYDSLLALYGADRPAVGFALETDALAALLPETAG